MIKWDRKKILWAEVSHSIYVFYWITRSTELKFYGKFGKDFIPGSVMSYFVWISILIN